MPSLDGLTAREAEVLTLVRERLTNAEIGERLFVSVRTVETHVSALLRKLGAADRRELARLPAAVVATTAAASRSTLPVPLTSFIGRTSERAQLADAVREHRLVTATGPGGVGKTRLALAVAGDIASEFDHGAVFVDLVKVARPELVVIAIADAADVAEGSGTSREDAMLVALADRHLLVVLDNCEHVQDEARVWAERLLTSCPRLHVLATSRVRLMLPFEHVASVPGLVVDPDADVDDAAALFVERMTAAGGDAPAGPADLERIREICAALDGMALGIELAAARAPGLGLDGLAGSLGSRLDLLDIGTRADDRHRSLRAAIDWSYHLLALDEQAVLQATAIFAAPADVASIVTIAERSPVVVLGALASLVDWNMVSRRAGPPTRYRTLETIRQYAVEAAEVAGRLDDLHAAHVAWCHARLDDLRTRAPGDAQWCAEVDAVLDDARLASAWAAQGGTPNRTAIALAGILADVLFQRGHPGEAQLRYQDAATLADSADERCDWLRLAAGAAAARNVGADAVELLVETAEIALAAGSADEAAADLAAAAALQNRASGIIQRPIDGAVVDAQLARARTLAAGAPRAEAAVAIAAGWGPRGYARSREGSEHALRLATDAGDRVLVDEAYDQLLAVELQAGDLDAAGRVVGRRLAALQVVPIDARSGFEHYDALQMACHVELALGRLAEARHYADAVASLPYLREQCHIGLARRLVAEAIAGDTDAVTADAAAFARDWQRAGRPVAGSLAVGAHAVAMVRGMVGDDDGRAQWIDITQRLVPSESYLDGPGDVWRRVLDALLALHLGHIDAADDLLAADPDGGAAGTSVYHHLWLPWYVGAWAEAAVLARRPDAEHRLQRAAAMTCGNDIVATIVERAAAMHQRRPEQLADLARRFSAAGCAYQAERTRALAASIV